MASFAASLHRSCSSPLSQWAVLGCWMFRAACDNRMSQQRHRGWGRSPSSMMIMVSCTWRCTKCTHIPIYVDALTYHPLNRHYCGISRIRKDTRYVWCSSTGGGVVDSHCLPISMPGLVWRCATSKASARTAAQSGNWTWSFWRDQCFKPAPVILNL